MAKHSFTTNDYVRGIKFLEHLSDFQRKTFYDFETFTNHSDIKPEDFFKILKLDWKHTQ